MNKWIIFIIIIAIVSVIGIGTNLVTGYTPLYESDSASNEKVTQQEDSSVIRFTNISRYTISPGVFVIHNPDFSMNFLGTQPPKAYESLAEIGDPSKVIALLKENSTVSAVFEVAEIKPGAVQEIIIPFSGVRGEEEYVSVRMSYMAMVVETNDGVVWLNGYSPYNRKDNQIQQENVVTEIIDMGTEQNAPIGSGFSGGQLDPTRGDENRDNGTATNEPAQHHPQFDEDDVIIQITVNS